MATQFAGVNLGEPIESVTFDTSTTGKDVEITFDDTVIVEPIQLDEAVEKLKAAIGQQTFPAA